jgi:anti-sigma factor RsiW
MRLRWWRRRSIVCRDAVALMTDYLDDQLDPKDRERLERHLADCPHCSEYLAQLRVTVHALGHAAPHDLSDEAVEELVSLYRRWQADGPGS